MPIVGIIGTLWMIWNIAEDAAARNQIYTIVGVMFLVIGVYAFIWLKSFRKVALFKSIPIERVMAMEHELYHEKRREAKISTKSISV
jgi:hypothetical protein